MNIFSNILKSTKSSFKTDMLIKEEKSPFEIKNTANPKIYAYEDTSPQYKGLLKVGFTSVDVKKRVAQQYPTARPGKLPYNIILEESAMRNDGSSFLDHDVHRVLKSKGIYNPKGEWFKCSVKDVKSAILALKNNESISQYSQRSNDFGLRPEQQDAIDKFISYYNSSKIDNENVIPKFLWNAKMRFGKTFTTYKLAEEMKWKKILVLTFKPAVKKSWQEDLDSHIDFEGWQFIDKDNADIDNINTNNPIVCFGSFQDFLGRNNAGGIKSKNEWVHATNWDCVVFDEYHYGAWRETAKDLFESESKDEQNYAINKDLQDFDQDIMPITTGAYLYLSGTPFRAISDGEFIEEQIYNWTYSDEQKAKNEYLGDKNPYESLPEMMMLTYKVPDSINKVAQEGEFNEFDLNSFFKAEGNSLDDSKFIHESEVQKWLDLIRGGLLETTIDNLKQGAKKPPFPFSDIRLLKNLNHTLWFLPSVASCNAMKKLLEQPQNKFYHDYSIVVAAGKSAGIGASAIEPVQQAMTDNPIESKTITLSCGKLVTGVTVKPWTGILMLRGTSSPETYFQAAFRVQSPWVIKNRDGLNPNKQEIMKRQCYVFDFAPNRALKLISDYSCRLDINEGSPEKKVADFINFLPVLCYDGSSMRQVNATDILDFALNGTSATLLAKKWESALLVNVDNTTLSKLLSNSNAMSALSNIEGFRSLNKDIETIINKSEKIKKTKKNANEKDLSAKEKKELTKEEKEYRSLRKQVQEKLIKFATRIPVFMYLTDYREETLKDVITQLEPGLFKSVTGLEIKDFELLVSLGVFNGPLMNDAVYKFKRYEESSLNYVGYNKEISNKVGLFDTIVSHDDL